MEHLPIDAVDHVSNPAQVNTVRKPISAALGMTDFAMVYHVLEPGEAFSAVLHTHHDVEEIFYIVDGTATFEVGEERTRVEVGAGEAIRFAPGDFQRGFNTTDEPVIGFIFSAPGPEHDWTQVALFFEYRAFGDERIHGVEPIEAGSWQADSIHLRTECTGCGKSITTADMSGSAHPQIPMRG